jgi:hypothetical protein
MILHNDLHISHDVSGNVIITIPKGYFQQTEKKFLLQSIAHLIQVETNNTNRPNSWDGDSAAKLIGLGKSDVHDGSLHHDTYLYGETG